jgi:ABC-type Fe3+-hydroxamate transport system substrate-binding protein
MKSLIAMLACLCAAALLPACSRSNNLVEGRVESKVGTHVVVVTDCYRTSVPAPQKVEATAAGNHETYRFTSCRDADIVITDEALTVNGTPYGRLMPTDTVTVDHGRVLINEREAQAASR